MIPIFLALAFIAIIFIIVIAGQPNEFKLSRSAKMTTLSVKKISHVNDLHK